MTIFRNVLQMFREEIKISKTFHNEKNKIINAFRYYRRACSITTTEDICRQNV